MPLLRRRTDFICYAALAAAVAISITFASAASSIAAEVTATRIGGSAVTGKLREWNESEIVIEANGGVQHISLQQLIALRWPSRDKPKFSESHVVGAAELVDGSEIPIINVSVRNAKERQERRVEYGSVTIEPALASDAQITEGERLPGSLVAAFRLKPFNETLLKQWQDIRKLNLPNDVLVVIKHDGASLDYVEGVSGDINADKVEFKIDGESNSIALSKVGGIVYSRPTPKSMAERKCILRGASGLNLNASQVTLSGEFLTIRSTCDASIRWPLDDLEVADYSSDKVTYLSDIDPASQSWTPLVGLPTGVSVAAQYGLPRRDHSAFGNALSLMVKNKDDALGQLGQLRSFDKGLALRSHSELVYRLPEGFKRFTALAGIDPATASTGNVRLKILADDNSLLDTEIAGNQPPQPIDVAISNAKRLKIVVDFGQNLDTGDWLNLCDAKIVK